MHVCNVWGYVYAFSSGVSCVREQVHQRERERQSESERARDRESESERARERVYCELLGITEVPRRDTHTHTHTHTRTHTHRRKKAPEKRHRFQVTRADDGSVGLVFMPLCPPIPTSVGECRYQVNHITHRHTHTHTHSLVSDTR
jgi:hypothetical protein